MFEFIMMAVRRSQAAKARDRSRRPRYSDEQIITLLVDKSPKRANAKNFVRFACYRTGMTVGEFSDAVVAAGFSRANALGDIRWDVEHGFIKIE